MTGIAKALLLCGTCRDPLLVDLLNDGQYTNFTTPAGWRVELGFVAADTIVRCPAHCRFVGESLAAGGHWEDCS